MLKSMILGMIRKRIAKLQNKDVDSVEFVRFDVDKINEKLSINSNFGGDTKPLSEFSEFAEMLENQFSKRVKIQKLFKYELMINFKLKSVNSEIFYLDEKGNKLNLEIKDVF
jgi:hypothetical protein